MSIVRQLVVAVGWAVIVAGILLCLYAGFLRIDGLGLPRWSVMLLFVGLPVLLGRTADRLWQGRR